MNNKPKIIVILGQTSTGKSDFAVDIAHEINGEIISADSRQVYKGMDLGTGKITKREMRGIPHHLLDVVSPKGPAHPGGGVFSVSDYKKLADKKIEEIIAKNKIPIICGGTGFYIDAVVNGIVLPEVEPNKDLRKKLEKKETPELVKILKKLDPERAKNIDIHNKVRLIRAIEIAKTLGSVPLLTKVRPLQEYNAIKIGLTLPDEILKEKIKVRLLARIKKGMIKEIENLHNKGVSWKRMEMLGLEYRYGALHMQGKITKQEMINELNTKIWHYAKRQKTWFKRDMKTIWIDPRDKIKNKKLLERINKFIN